VVGSANTPRPPSVRRAIAYKLAATPLEYESLLNRWPEFETKEGLDAYLSERDLKISVWTAEDLGVDEGRLGLSGSPTKVLKVDYVVLKAEGSKAVESTEEGIAELMHELVEDYIL
jgi:electron transfer flavoprotein beta subunit